MPLACSLPTFDLQDMLRCGREIRKTASGAVSLEQAAQRVCALLYNSLTDGADGGRGCVLVRCYKTHALSGLPHELRTFVQNRYPDSHSLTASTKCLVLIGTVGDEPEWNARRKSVSHQAIPLPSADMIQRAPMIASLFHELGVDFEQLVAPSRNRELRPKTYSVFHVENALGSPAIPAQEDFVARYGVRSVVGCGGELPLDDMFATIFFCRVPVVPHVAERFRTLALDMKASFFPFRADQVFAED